MSTFLEKQLIESSLSLYLLDHILLRDVILIYILKIKSFVHLLSFLMIKRVINRPFLTYYCATKIWKKSIYN